MKDSLHIEHTDSVAAAVATPAPEAVAKPRAVAVADTLAAPDSIAADTLVADVVAPVATVTTAPPPPPAWMSGLPPQQRPDGSADSGVTGIIVALILLVLLALRNSHRLIPAMVKDLLSVRTRDKSFDEHTSNETRLVALFGVQLSVYLGILLKGAVDTALGRPPLVADVIDLLPVIAICGAYYIFQICAYSTVGYAFATPNGRRLWLRGLNAVQTLLGFALAIPALLLVFYPVAATYALTAGAALYILARLIFISKGIRIFFDNFGSLIYFILYLCTLEIIPLIALYNLAIEFCSNA